MTTLLLIPPTTVRDRAQALRSQGYTHTEICKLLGPIPKGTVSYWLRNITLTPEQQKRVHEKIVASAAQGRPLATAAWERTIREWQQTIEVRVKKLGALPYLHAEIGKLVLGIMYLCEGAKYPSSRQLLFGNSDPEIIGTFLSLLRRYYAIAESKLHGRVMRRWDQDGVALIRFWSRITGIAPAQLYHSYPDKRTKNLRTLKLHY